MSVLHSKADIHIHTTYSDGAADVAAILGHVAARTDLQVIAITDHDTIAGALQARQLAHQFGVEVIVGEEVSTLEGHLLALFIDHWLPPGRPAAETIAAVHAQGGLCVAAHAFDPLVPSLGRAGLSGRCVGARAGEWPLDGVEAFNAGSWIASGNQRADAFGAARGLARCGGSDSHGLATVGRGYTLFAGTSADDLYRAIVSGQTAPGGAHWRIADYLAIATYRARDRGRDRGALLAPPAEAPVLAEAPRRIV